MKPILERSDQVVARVVAWHNRHPLALRITPEQVHSVGVVSLPYAVRGASVQGPAPAAALVAAPAVPAEGGAGSAIEPVPAAADQGADEAVTEVAIEAIVEFEPELPPADDSGVEPAVEEAAAAPSANDDARPAEAGSASILDRALAAGPVSADSPAGAAKQADLAEPADSTALATAAAQALSNRPCVLPPRPKPWHPLTWWGRLRGRPPFHALFSEDFIRPLRPRRVAGWVARHGAGSRPLEPMAPQRLIVLDASCRKAGDDATEVDLHVITAAIGLGDERQRLLLAPDGRVLGHRRWSRPRLAAAAGTAGAVIALVGGGWIWQGGAHGGITLAHQAMPAASAASAPTAAVAGSAPNQASASRPPAAASASASAPAPEALAAAPTASAASGAAPDTVHAQAVDPVAQDAAASAPEALVAAAPVASAPRNVAPRRGRIELPPLVPRLADGERHELRANSRELRREPAVLPDAKAWALVTTRLSDKRQSDRVAAQLHAIALLQPVPMRAELMPVGSGWRAVFWPFSSVKDAEKVRLALADKGLQTEVIEF